MKCTRCDGTGYLNTHQLPDDVDGHDPDAVDKWIAQQIDSPHDVQVCDCCGNGEDHYGIPGEHYSPVDRAGEDGPYAGNGGLAHCH